MSHSRGRSVHGTRPEDESIINLEAFGRTVHATASHLIGHDTYQTALGEIHRELRRPLVQRSVFSLAKANPREILRSTLSATEVQHRALTHLPDDLLRHVPESTSNYSLFQGYQASAPEEPSPKKKHSRRSSKGQKLLAESGVQVEQGGKLQDQRSSLKRRLEMMNVRKNMCVSEIRDIDQKMANLGTMRRLVLDRLAALEQDELDLENDLVDVEAKIQDEPPALPEEPSTRQLEPENSLEQEEASDFMSESVYQKLPSPKSERKKRRVPRRTSMPVLHEHLTPGTRIRDIQAHTDHVTALDFDVPFGTLVTSSLDDTVRVWDLNNGRCMGMLEGHLSSVRCLQVEDNLVATGSMDATIRLWDLSQAEYTPPPPASETDADWDEEEEGNSRSRGRRGGPATTSSPPSSSSMADCPVFTLSAHVAEVTALHFQNKTLVSGSADKTLRQWDLEKGRCVQTLDVLWAAAQASTLSVQQSTSAAAAAAGAGSPFATTSPTDTWWQPGAGRQPATAKQEADFVGALQVFDAALACGTADGMVRLWDLRSGTVHRSLVGHTGPVTALQFDNVHLVTASADRSIRIWDLRTGTIYDAFAYDAPITAMQFDARRIVAAVAGEPVVKVYDKADGRHWDCCGAAPGSSPDIGAGFGGSGPASASYDVSSVVTSEAESAVGSVSPVEAVRIKEGYLVEGRRDGVVGVWAC